MIASIISIVFTLLLFLIISYSISKEVNTISDFLPVKRFLDSKKYSGTTIASGMSLATVMIALINLAPILGISLIITVFTYSLGFIVLYLTVSKIRKLNPNNHSLPFFLGTRYNSKAITKSTSLFSLIGYSSIFAMELIVGVTIFKPFFGEYTIYFSIIFFIFILLYTYFSGYRGIVLTDKWQLRFIFISIFSLITFLVWKWFEVEVVIGSHEFSFDLLTTWTAPLSFCIGIAAMNIPATICDIGTWQRVCTTKSTSEVKRGIIKVIPIFIVIWTIIILIGIFYSIYYQNETMASYDGALLDNIINSFAFSSNIFGDVLLFLLISGLLSAMVSTADSLLIATSHTFIDGFIKDVERYSLQRIKKVIIVLGATSFSMFLFFYYIEFNVVQLVFAIYGAQIALFPVTFAGLFSKENLNRPIFKVGAIISITLGFVGAWTIALFSQFDTNNSMQFYSPIVGLIISSIIFIAFYFVSKIRKNTDV